MPQLTPAPTRLDESVAQAIAAFATIIQNRVSRKNVERFGLCRQDIVQEVYIRIWRFIQRSSGRSLSQGYIVRTVSSCVIDAARKSASLGIRIVDIDELPEHAEPREASPDPEQYTRAFELGAAVELELQQIPPVSRAAVSHHLQGLTLDESAAALGLSRDATRKRVERGLKHLEKRLESEFSIESVGASEAVVDSNLAARGGQHFRTGVPADRPGR